MSDLGHIDDSANFRCRKKYASKTILVVYGEVDEEHEVAVETESTNAVSGDGLGITTFSDERYLLVGVQIRPGWKLVEIDSDLQIYFMGKLLRARTL